MFGCLKATMGGSGKILDIFFDGCSMLTNGVEAIYTCLVTDYTIYLYGRAEK
jgi:hypothetical protein